MGRGLAVKETLLCMKNKDAKWSIERTHLITGEIFYLSPGEVNWIPPRDHQKYGTRYGRWVWSEAEEIIAAARLRHPKDFTYIICLFEKINNHV